MAKKTSQRGTWYDYTIAQSSVVGRRKVCQTLQRMWSSRRDIPRSSRQRAEETRLAGLVPVFTNIRKIFTILKETSLKTFFPFNNGRDYLQPLVRTCSTTNEHAEKNKVVIEDNMTLIDTCPPRYLIDNRIPMADYNDHVVARCIFCLFLENFKWRVLKCRTISSLVCRDNS